MNYDVLILQHFNNLNMIQFFLGDLTKTFELRIQDEFLSPDPKERPKLSAILVDRLFR